MKKLLLLLALVLLLNAGCQQKESIDQSEAEISPGAYLLTIPKEGWTQPTDNLWVRLEGDRVIADVRLWVRKLADCTEQQAADILQAEGYMQLAAPDNAHMSKQENEIVYMVQICLSAASPDVWLVHYCYPADKAAQWEPVLSELAASFELLE